MSRNTKQVKQMSANVEPKSLKKDISVVNPKNYKIVKELGKLVEQIKHDLTGPFDRKKKLVDSIRLKKFQELIIIISRYPNEITSGEQISHLKGVGKGSVSRINEILKTGKLSEIKIDRQDKKLLAEIKDLISIHGIGESTALDLIKSYNIHSVSELKKAYAEGKVPLNDQILVGLKYSNVFENTIPRSEIDKINLYFKKISEKINNGLEFVICGSYRRGKLESKDIDVLLFNKTIITKQDLQTSPNYLHMFINELKRDKFIVEDIDEGYSLMYMGFCKLPGKPIRRLDVIYVPYEAYATALLHFTGSGPFNEKMRHHAKLLGYRLNQYGLYKKIKPKNEKKTKGKKERDENEKVVRMKTFSEEQIFNLLGMEYLEPKDRV